MNVPLVIPGTSLFKYCVLFFLASWTLKQMLETYLQCRWQHCTPTECWLKTLSHFTSHTRIIESSMVSWERSLLPFRFVWILQLEFNSTSFIFIRLEIYCFSKGDVSCKPKFSYKTDSAWFFFSDFLQPTRLLKMLTNWLTFTYSAMTFIKKRRDTRTMPYKFAIYGLSRFFLLYYSYSHLR